MTTIASRDLRNHTADVLKQVALGERVTITVNGKAVAELGPPPSHRQVFMTKLEAIDLLNNRQADPNFTSDPAFIAGDTTDDLGPIR